MESKSLFERRMQRVFRWVLWNFRYSGQLKRFKDYHRGEDCFLVGNGPSLNNLDLSLTKGKHVIGLNKIFLLFKRVPLDLSYHVAVNSYVMEQSSSEIEKLNCCSFLSYTNGASRYVKSLPHVKFIKTGAFNKWGFQKDLEKPLFECNTVTYVAMQLAYYLGFSRVFLIGVDHNFQQSGAPDAAQKMVGEDKNHFDPSYFAGQTWQLANLEASEVGYQLAKYYYKSDKREILNATLGGHLNVFPTISYADAIKECRPKLKEALVR